jgi:hypothetical protein
MHVLIVLDLEFLVCRPVLSYLAAAACLDIGLDLNQGKNIHIHIMNITLNTNKPYTNTNIKHHQY